MTNDTEKDRYLLVRFRTGDFAVIGKGSEKPLGIEKYLCNTSIEKGLLKKGGKEGSVRLTDAAVLVSGSEQWRGTDDPTTAPANLIKEYRQLPEKELHPEFLIHERDYSYIADITDRLNRSDNEDSE